MTSEAQFVLKLLLRRPLKAVVKFFCLGYGANKDSESWWEGTEAFMHMKSHAQL